MKRNVSVVRFKFRCNILITGKIIKEMSGSVASGTHCIKDFLAKNNVTTLERAPYSPDLYPADFHSFPLVMLQK